MAERADAVVVGAGILGASVAHFLTKIGYGDVALLDKGGVCSGSTQYSAAHVRQHYTNEVAIRLAVRAVEMFERDEEELGGPSGFVQHGYLLIAPAGQEQAVQEVVPRQQSFGVQATIVSADEIRARWPEFDLEDVAIGSYERTSGYADPVQTVRSLVSSAQRSGLQLHEGRAVTGIKRQNGKVTGVETAAGDIDAGVVVNCGGPWGDRISRMVGIEVPIVFSREHEAQFELPEDFGELPVVSDVPQRLYFRRYGEGKILVGQGWPKQVEPADPESYDTGADPAAVESMTAKLLRRLPSLQGRLGKQVAGYSGVYDITPDWYPVVGPEPEVDGYYSAFGGSGHCFKLGPAIGEALADVIAGREPAIDISSLSRSRFESGRTFDSVWGPGNRA
jgi:sarcosine oxidase subunit beta